MSIREIGVGPSGTIADSTVEDVVRLPLLVEVRLLIDKEFAGIPDDLFVTRILGLKEGHHTNGSVVGSQTLAVNPAVGLNFGEDKVKARLLILGEFSDHGRIRMAKRGPEGQAGQRGIFSNPPVSAGRVLFSIEPSDPLVEGPSNLQLEGNGVGRMERYPYEERREKAKRKGKEL